MLKVIQNFDLTEPNQSLQRIARNVADGSVVAGWAIAELGR